MPNEFVAPDRAKREAKQIWTRIAREEGLSKKQKLEGLSILLHNLGLPLTSRELKTLQSLPVLQKYNSVEQLT